jgi:hypothetical protein
MFERSEPPSFGESAIFDVTSEQPIDLHRHNLVEHLIERPPHDALSTTPEFRQETIPPCQ